MKSVSSPTPTPPHPQKITTAMKKEHRIFSKIAFSLALFFVDQT
jgi:hypothetical protein